MRWYLRFWYHYWRAGWWKRRAREARINMTAAEARQWHHEGEWALMKQSLKDFK